MLRHDDNPESTAPPAVQDRVPTEELTRALAEIGARRARQAFEQAGTLTLAEALQESDVEATQEELAAEVKEVREADALEAEKQKRRQRLRLILRAEIASVLLCGLTLLSLSRTVYNPQWQASHQIDEVKNELRLTQGPNPRYNIFVVPSAFRRSTTSGSVVNGGSWSGSPAYPLSVLPDGYNIHHYEGLDDDGHASLGTPDAFGAVPFMPTFPAYFEFREVQSRSSHESVSVFYNGLCYRRGWIRKSDIPNLLHGQPFRYYSEPVDDPQDNHAGLVPLTLSGQSIAEANFQEPYTPDTSYDFLAFTAGPPVQLDEHAWETF